MLSFQQIKMELFLYTFFSKNSGNVSYKTLHSLAISHTFKLCKNRFSECKDSRTTSDSGFMFCSKLLSQ